MSELDSLYREVILDHYKNPRGHGVIDDADAQAEGQNPLCGDEVSIAIRPSTPPCIRSYRRRRAKQEPSLGVASSCDSSWCFRLTTRRRPSVASSRGCRARSTASLQSKRSSSTTVI